MVSWAIGTRYMLGTVPKEEQTESRVACTDVARSRLTILQNLRELLLMEPLDRKRVVSATRLPRKRALF